MNQCTLEPHRMVESVVTMLIPQFAKGKKGPEREDAVYTK